MKRRHFVSVMISLLAVSSLCPAVSLANQGVASSSNTTPQATIERYHAVLLAAMKEAEALGIRGRYDLIDGAAWSTFDFPGMAGRVTGRAWREASDADREAMARAFGHLSVATYAKRFKGWSGQAFQTLGTDPGPRGTTLVKTQIAAAGDKPVALTYVMNQEADGSWRIIDILLKGTISELAVKKSEYASLLKSKGLDGLTSALNTQADKLLSN